MPKMKTHRASAKRFRVTRGGKVLHRKATGNHMLMKKTGSRKRRIEGTAELSAVREQKKIKRLLAR
jgi:large subunit ribosomal protein L35